MSIPGFIDGTDAQQDTVASRMGTTTAGTMVYQVRNGVNYYGPPKTYTYKTGHNSTLTQFLDRLYESIYNDCSPILHARTEKLHYYEEPGKPGVFHKSSHYICVTQMGNQKNTLKVKDCNFNDAFYGEFTVTPQEAFDCVGKYGSTSCYYIYAE